MPRTLLTPEEKKENAKIAAYKYRQRKKYGLVQSKVNMTKSSPISPVKSTVTKPPKLVKIKLARTDKFKVMQLTDVSVPKVAEMDIKFKDIPVVGFVKDRSTKPKKVKEMKPDKPPKKSKPIKDRSTKSIKVKEMKPDKPPKKSKKLGPNPFSKMTSLPKSLQDEFSNMYADINKLL